MALSPTEKTILANEINQDPLALGYAGKTNQQMADVMNAPGSASAPNRVPVVSETPVLIKGRQMMDEVIRIDGMTERKNAYGASLGECLKWVDITTDDLVAYCVKYCFHPAATFDIADAEHRDMINYLAGVEIGVGSPPVTYTVISEAAMEAVLALGMVLMNRSREIMGRSITATDVTEALA